MALLINRLLLQTPIGHRLADLLPTVQPEIRRIRAHDGPATDYAGITAEVLLAAGSRPPKYFAQNCQAVADAIPGGRGLVNPRSSHNAANIARDGFVRRRRAADLFLSMQNVLPDRYPLQGTEIDVVLADENFLGRVFDYGVIAPRSNRCTGLRRTTSTSPGCPISAPSGLRSTPGPSNIGTSGGRADLGSGLLSLAPCWVLRSREPAPT